MIEAAIFIGTVTMTFNYETHYQHLTCSVLGVQVSLEFAGVWGCVCVFVLFLLLFFLSYFDPC